jgi:N-acetylglucosamine malate deacetylase 2
MLYKIFVAIFLLFAATSMAQKSKTILFIGAHPDDETAISEVLIKYAKLGNKVYVMIATDGRDGTRVTTIPAGDSLGSLRKKESICGCKILGTEPPIFLSIERLDTRIGTGKYFKTHRQLMDSLRKKLPAINPDVIITFGPDGDTHHSEHIVVGACVTELLLAEGWVEKYPLYYFGWTKDAQSVDDLGYVDEQYFNVRIDYTTAEKQKAIEALQCYVTQYTPKELKEEEERKLKEKSNRVYFRQFVVKKGMRSDF